MTPVPISLGERDTAADAARSMKECDVGDVLVRSADGSLCGIVTDRDLVVRCLADGKSGDTTLGELCTSGVNTLDANASIDEAVGLMRRQAVRRIPILENGELVGIVSLGDLARERDPDSALGRISAAPATA
jgi:signal-transduction protein with cAMP-binding, CBS, and nucleotidyltransferase domain